MKNILAALSAVTVLVLTPALHQGRTNHAAKTDRSDKRDTSLNATISHLEAAIPKLMDEGDVPGLSIALISNGTVSWSRAFGVKNTTTGEPVTETTVFEAASLSKPVFAYAVLKLADQGRIELDTPLSKYLPNYIGGDDRINLITARMVLSHRTGFPNWRQGPDVKILFTPGDRFSYSGEGFAYLGKVVERITGKQFNDFMHDMVFAPLGMANSSYVWRADYDRLSATGHNEDRGPAWKGKPTAANPAASLHTTALDYAKFVIAVMKGVGLNPETAAMMLKPQVKVDPSCTICTQAKPARVSDSLAWGLGVGLEHNPTGDSFWHWGDNGAFKCYMQAYARLQTGVVILTNSAYGLSIIPDIVDIAIGGSHPTFEWIKYDRYDSASHRLLKAVLKDGAGSAIKQYREAIISGQMTEGSVNSIGYVLLRSKRIKDSVAIFELNAQAHPESWNAYDSLGEAYMEDGQKELAITNYKKAIELNPGNENGIRILKRLEAK